MVSDLTTIRLPKVVNEVYEEVRRELGVVVSGVGLARYVGVDRISLAFLNGLKNEDVPRFRRINRKWRELPIAIEIDSRELRHAAKEELKYLYSVAALKALICVGRKYKAPTRELEKLLGDMTWNRSIVIVGASMTVKYRNPGARVAMQETMVVLAKIIREDGYFSGASFRWVYVSLRFAEEESDGPQYVDVHSAWEYLMIAMNVDVAKVRHAPYVELKRMIECAGLSALIIAGQIYQRPTIALKRRLAELCG